MADGRRRTSGLPGRPTLRRGSRTSPMSARSRPGRMHAAMFDLMRGDRARVAANAFELTRLAREFDLNLCFARSACFLRVGRPLQAARRRAGSRACGAASNCCANKRSVLRGLLKIALGRGGGSRGRPRRAVAILDETLATAERTGFRPFDAELQRVPRRILVKREPADAAPAEEAFRAAITVAKQRVRATSDCGRRSRSPSSTNPPPASSKPTAYSPRRSKALRRRRKCPRSSRRRRCSRRWTRPAK